MRTGTRRRGGTGNLCRNDFEESSVEAPSGRDRKD